MRLDVDQARHMVRERLGAERVPARQGELQTGWLIEADLRGHPSHGIQRLPTIIRRIRAGLTDPDSEGDHCWTAPAALTVDGGRGLGPCVGVRAVDEICERAIHTGVAVAAIHNANHLGILAPYVERASLRGLVAIALTTSEALVHPWGGRSAMVGTNPIAIGVPAEPDAFVLDMATGAVSMGRILAHLHRGEELLSGWAVDAHGSPTTDPKAAADGAISPFGGAKGYALGLALEAVVGALTGSALGPDVRGTLDSTAESNKGDVFVCVDPRALAGGAFRSRLTNYLQQVRDSPPQVDGKAPSIPGDGARARRELALAEGVEVADSVLVEIEALDAEPRP